jgi:hypothetical protein
MTVTKKICDCCYTKFRNIYRLNLKYKVYQDKKPAVITKTKYLCARCAKKIGGYYPLGLLSKNKSC